MSRNKLFVESSVACKVGSRSLPLADWSAVVQYLTPQFEFVVSPLSFVEVLRSLALGKDQYIIPNLKRVEALSPIDPPPSGVLGDARSIRSARSARVRPGAREHVPALANGRSNGQRSSP
jgi:hypothetical protein